MDYKDFTDWMFGLERFGIKLGLENISEFLARIGNPHKSLKTVHVTGTNGKGSVCVMTAEILRKHGLKVGLYTSPHLVDFRERIVVNGKEIPERDVVRIGTELKEEMEKMVAGNVEQQLTFFEFTTALAFRYLGEQKVDVAVAEVGMGGRLDATNVMTPMVSAITRIGLEHTNYLGSTIPDIAREKAGIIKAGANVVTCEGRPDALAVISNACEKKGVTLRRIDVDFSVSNVNQTLEGTGFDYSGKDCIAGLKTSLLGRYQAENAAATIAIVEELRAKGFDISDDEIRKGLASVRWPGRLDIVSKKPLIIFDGSHNPDGVATTTSILDELGITPMTFVLGCMDDKDYASIARAIAPHAARIISTQAKYKRALPAERLGKSVDELFKGPKEVTPFAVDAFEKAMEDIRGKGVCIIGSLYLVGEAIQWWRSKEKAGLHHSHKI